MFYSFPPCTYAGLPPPLPSPPPFSKENTNSRTHTQMPHDCHNLIIQIHIGSNRYGAFYDVCVWWICIGWNHYTRCIYTTGVIQHRDSLKSGCFLFPAFVVILFDFVFVYSFTLLLLPLPLPPLPLSLLPSVSAKLFEIMQISCKQIDVCVCADSIKIYFILFCAYVCVRTQPFTQYISLKIDWRTPYFENRIWQILFSF